MPHLSFPLCDKKNPGDSSHSSKGYRGISLRSCPFSSIPPHISESFSFVSPGNRSTFFKLSFKKKKKKRRKKKRPLHVLLCPLITRLSLKQMADHRPVYINTRSFERGVQKLGLASLEIHESQIIEIKAHLFSPKLLCFKESLTSSHPP